LLKAGDRSQSVGMGIVVDERHVVSCAHVVNSALGRRFESLNEPDEKIRVAFPYSDSEAVYMGRVCLWHPMGPDRFSDVAVLELDDNVPEGTGIAPLASANELVDHDFKVFGFREESIKGNIVAVQFMGPLPDGTVQIDGSGEHGIFIESGFSGAAVWDTNLRAVVGLVSSRNINPAERVAYMIPVRALK
jgi:Trypsin-like peptidase domain